MTIADYFQYELEISRLHLVPLLLRHGAVSEGARVLDVGCGYGGTLLALCEAVPDLHAKGLDLDGTMVAGGQRRLGRAATLIQANFFDWSGGPLDLVLMRDVLEHIGNPEKALARATALLAPGGFLFASFAPYWGPFGAHQHNASGAFSCIPWIQVLPQKWLRRALKVQGNSYKSRESLEDDIQSVLRTRLTFRRFERAVRAVRLQSRFQAAYLSRPDYRIKFGLPTIQIPLLHGSAEILATGVEALMQLAPKEQSPPAPRPA